MMNSDAIDCDPIQIDVTTSLNIQLPGRRSWRVSKANPLGPEMEDQATSNNHQNG